MSLSNLIKKNRSILFLAVTMIVGILLIGIQIFREIDEIKGDEIVNDAANTNFKELENKIQNLKNQNFNPTFYNTLATEIDASYQQELITSTAKNNLMSNLTSVYSNLVYSRCEFYLTGTNLNTSTEVLNWLQQLENITARNSKIDFYRTQIKAYDYYSNEFIRKVNGFNPGNFDEHTYYKLKTEASEMPKLNAKYRSQKKFNKIKEQSKENLERVYRCWLDPTLSECQ